MSQTTTTSSAGVTSDIITIQTLDPTSYSKGIASPSLPFTPLEPVPTSSTTTGASTTPTSKTSAASSASLSGNSLSGLPGIILLAWMGIFIYRGLHLAHRSE
ncbi:hypothetical protein BGZ60DRAFT_534722 [Tricladium varicosporioides]|nr:hypothetical protein BGZ60DRAFT_534722 [Hymenoscyphus varicosporioides]